MRKSSGKNFFLLFLIIATTCLIYYPSFKNPFIWDDFHLIIGEENIRTIGNLASIFKTHLYRHGGGSNFYRPAQSLSFMIDYFFWKLNPLGYHLTNLFFHLLTALLIYFLVSGIFKNKDIGFLTALIFAVHPINTEAVTYISGRADPISSVFFLTALLFYILFRQRQKAIFLIFSLLSFIFSLLTKEAVLIFPLVLILYDALIYRDEKTNLKLIKLYVPYFVIVLVYILFRFFILGLPSGLGGHIPFKPLLLMTLKILVLYLWLLFCPINLHMERLETPIRSILEPQAISASITLICLIWLSIICYRRSRRLFFFIAFFLITLLPMLNILPINAPMAEHWLYLPSIGLYAIMSYFLNRALFQGGRLKAKLTAAVFIGLLAFFCAQTVIQNIRWGRPFEFYQRIIKNSPNSVRAHLNLGSLYMANKNYKLAKQEFQLAHAIFQESPFCHFNLGVLALIDDKKDEAVKCWETALDIAPFYQPARRVMKLFLGKNDKRFRKLSRAVEVNPKNIIANYRLSKLYLRHNLYIEALDRLERILGADPKYANALFNRAWIYSKLGIYTTAIKEYEKLALLTPDDPDIYINLGFCYGALNRHKEREQAWQKAVQLHDRISNP